MKKPIIRAAVPADAAGLAAIDRDCFRPEIAFDVEEIRYYLEKPDAVALLAEAETGILGFVIADRKSRRTADIITLDVLPAFRRQGVASDLFRRAEDVLSSRGVGRCRLQVDTGNLVALNFYARRGYRIVRTLAGYYPDGADAHLMSKDLGAGEDEP